MRQPGTVARWLEDKGFGFIKPIGAGPKSKDVFVHHSSLPADCVDAIGKRQIEVGAAVTFDIEQTEKGPAAVRVERST